jgi:hypothetical protein
VLVLILVSLLLPQLRDERVRECGVHSGVESAVELFKSCSGIKIGV